MKSDTHVYRINMPRLLVLPLVWLFFVALLLIPLATGAASHEATGAMAVAALLTVVLGPLFYCAVWRSRLELNDAGITHFQFGYTVHSAWSNLERISTRPGAEGLYLAQPGTDSKLLRDSARALQVIGRMLGMGSGFGDYEALAAGRFIALTTFTSHLKGGPLGRDLAHWAPQLVVSKVAP